MILSVAVDMSLLSMFVPANPYESLRRKSAFSINTCKNTKDSWRLVKIPRQAADPPD